MGAAQICGNGRTDRQAGMTKVIYGFHNYTKCT